MALGETAIHTSPSHHYVRLRSLLPSRFSSSHFVWPLLYASSVFPSAHSLLLFCRVGFIAGIIYYVGRLLSTVASFLQCFLSCLFSWLLLLTLGFTSPEFVEICFSYTLLSEDCSDESSELSPHQSAHPTLLRIRLPSWALIKSLVV